MNRFAPTVPPESGGPPAGPQSRAERSSDISRPSLPLLLLQSLKQDVAAIPFRLAVNRIGGHALMPRSIRWLIYRLCGLDVATPNIYADCTFIARNVHIGGGTFVNRGCLFEGAGPLVIGRDCQIAMEAMFLTSTHSWTGGGRFSHRPENLATTVGDCCWIGARATILPGVTVGDGCVVAAGAVVTKDCQPGHLYAGVPARPIRDLRSGSRCG